MRCLSDNSILCAVLNYGCINLGNQKIIQLVKKYPACDGNRRFTRHWILTYDEYGSNSQNFQFEIQKINTKNHPS